MNRLEERYRRVLRLLPAAYRQEWEDDMVAAFLHSMATDDPETTEYAADYGRPSLAEIVSVVSLAVRLRMGLADGSSRSYAWGQAIRLATLTAMLTNAVMVTSGIAFALWLSGKISWLPDPPPEWVLPPSQGIRHTWWMLAGYAWLPAYIALVLGHRRAAQAVALLAIVPTALTTVVELAAGDIPLSVSPWANQLVDVLLLLGMAAFPHDPPSAPRRGWLLALPIGVLLVPLPLFAVQATDQAWRLLDWPGVCCALVIAAVLVHLAGRASGRTTPPPHWSLALTLLAGTALALRLLTLPDYSGQPQRATLVTIAMVEAAAVLAVGIPLAVHAIRSLRRLPPVPVGAPMPTDPTG